MNPGYINAAARNYYKINTNTNRYRRVRNNIINNSKTLEYPKNIARKIFKILETQKNNNRMNNINRVYKKRYGILNNSYKSKKYFILKQLNSLPLWNIRRHNRNPNKIAYFIRIGQIK